MKMPPQPNLKQLAELVKSQDRKIKKLQGDIVNLKSYVEYEEAPKQEVVEEEKSNSMNISPTVVITTIGIIGVIIGLISFFTYAISNNWIGPTAQIGIGVAVGLILFLTGYLLFNKHEKWSITSLGGAIVVELISIGFGVWYYDILNEIFAMSILIIFLLIGVGLSLKYDSLLIAYFSVIGAIITPIISATYTKPVFTAIFLIALSIGTLILSTYKKWGSLRLVSFGATMLYGVTYLFNSFQSTYDYGLSAKNSIIFLAIYFLIYNISSIIFSVRNDKAISELDIALLNLNTLISAGLLVKIFFDGEQILTKKVFGIILLVLSLFFLLEVYVLKSKYSSNKNLKPTLYSLLSSGIILINIGLVLIFNASDPINLIILSLPQWLLYSLLSKSTDDEEYYSIFSYIFLAISVIWWIYYLIIFPQQLANANYVIITMVVLMLALLFSIKKDLSRNICVVIIIPLFYSFIYALTQYLKLISNVSGDVTTTLLSVVWLIYTLTLYIKTRKTKKTETLSKISLGLLILTLAKIAFLDLTRLEGVIRIVGFIVFGILLLIGGYLLRK